MSSHWRELKKLYAHCLGSNDFDSSFTNDDTKSVRQCFASRAMVASDNAAGFKKIHEWEALTRVCNAMLHYARECQRGASTTINTTTTTTNNNHDGDGCLWRLGTESDPVNPPALTLVDELLDDSEARLSWKFLIPFLRDPAAVSVMHRTLERAVILFHYATARPRQFDMFVHLSAYEMFFIDGDSLLMAALSSPHVDWDCMQPLHVMHNAQAILQRLQMRGANFHVVFFAQMAWIWEKAPQKLFIRENMRLALTAVSESNPGAGLLVYNFASFHDAAFAEHVQRYAPEFMLITDGEQLGRPSALHRLFHNDDSTDDNTSKHHDGNNNSKDSTNDEYKAEPYSEDVDAAIELRTPYRSIVEDEVHGESVSFYFRCFHLWLTAKRIKVAYSTRMVIKENAVIVFAVTAQSERFARAIVVVNETIELAKSLEHTATVCQLPRVPHGHAQMGSNNGNTTTEVNEEEEANEELRWQAVVRRLNNPSIPLRERVAGLAVYDMMRTRRLAQAAAAKQAHEAKETDLSSTDTANGNRKDNRTEQQEEEESWECQRQLCIALIITAYCTRMMDSSVRAQPAPRHTPQLTRFLHQLAAPHLLRALNAYDCLIGRGEEFDLYDGHLFAALVRQLRHTPLCHLLDEDGVLDVMDSCRDVLAAAGVWDEARDAALLQSSECTLSALPNEAQVHRPESESANGCVRYTHELVEQLAKRFNVTSHVPASRADCTTVSHNMSQLAIRNGSPDTSNNKGDDDTSHDNSSNKPSKEGALSFYYPEGLGHANRLSGWVVSKPFDELNDVVDSYVEREKRRDMTDRERRRAEEQRNKFMRDAKEQAESLGMGGFTRTQITMVPIGNDGNPTDSESNNNDSNSNANSNKKSGKDKDTTNNRRGGGGGNSKTTVKQVHAGQHNKKTRSNDDKIREAANLEKVNVLVRATVRQVNTLLRTVDLGNAANVNERAGHVEMLSEALTQLSSVPFGEKFDLADTTNQAYGNKDSDEAKDEAAAKEQRESDETPLHTRMWRLLVQASKKRESEFALSVDDNPTSTHSTNNSDSDKSNTLYAITLIRQFVRRHICLSDGTPAMDSPAHASSAVSSKRALVWGAFSAWHTRYPHRTPDDAFVYLMWVYLTHVQQHLRTRLMARIVRFHLESWKEERERARMSQSAPKLASAVTLFLYCHHKLLRVVRDYGLTLASEDVDVVRGALAHFDFPGSYLAKVDRAIESWQGGTPLAAVPNHLLPRHRMTIAIAALHTHHHSDAEDRSSDACVGGGSRTGSVLTPEMMQLMHMGHLLERPIIAARDYRVVFNPDSWQRELLDIVDARGSAVVCAPTSAGKTFISYYCMFNTLRTSDRKVVVYVAPNRALINQAVADVCARYSSKQYREAGRSVYGVHGGVDYHHYLTSCQVLITLPDILEKMLLSPRYTNWVKQLDYCILDEIHTMESSGNGEVWERVLALLPCPFVALSATLGETQELCGWLSRVQQNRSVNNNNNNNNNDSKNRNEKKDHDAVKRTSAVRSIPAPGSPAIQRWNDIKKYMYLPPPHFAPQLTRKLTARCDTQHIQDLHPLSVLTLEQLQRGFPPDVSLVPSEVVQLYQVMHSRFEHVIAARWLHDAAAAVAPGVALVQGIKMQLAALKPEQYFAQVTYITQTQARLYESDVKNLFAYWAYLSSSASAVEQAAIEAEAEAEAARRGAESVTTNAPHTGAQEESSHSAGPREEAAEAARELVTALTDVCQFILRHFSQRLRVEEATLDAVATEAAQRKLTTSYAEQKHHHHSHRHTSATREEKRATRASEHAESARVPRDAEDDSGSSVSSMESDADGERHADTLADDSANINVDNDNSSKNGTNNNSDSDDDDSQSSAEITASAHVDPSNNSDPASTTDSNGVHVTHDINPLHHMSKSHTDSETDHTAHFPDSKAFVQSHIIPVLREINARDMGPTIVFTFENEDCIDLVQHIVNELEAAEVRYREGEEFAQYAAGLRKRAAAAAAALRQRESTLRQKRLTTDADGHVERADRSVDDETEAAALEAAAGAGGAGEFAVPEVLPEFSLTPTSTPRTMDYSAVEKARRVCQDVQDELAERAMMRGVGLHHAGMNGKLRRHMEILFRGRHCGVIVATETLALGIHSPCRSVVIAGDHVLLNTTQFRQMMGRAGRRGLDTLGHVVFLGVGLTKITRLMTSGMTVIKGNVHCDAMTQLRMLQMHDYVRHRQRGDRTSSSSSSNNNSNNNNNTNSGSNLFFASSAECQQHALSLTERLVVNPLFFTGRASVEGHNMEPLTVELFQFMLQFFQREGLHLRHCPSSLGSLLTDVLTVFSSSRIAGQEGFAFTQLLTRGIFRYAGFAPLLRPCESGLLQNSGGSELKKASDAVMELLAYVFTRHPLTQVSLEVHRSVLSDPVVQQLWRYSVHAPANPHRADTQAKEKHAGATGTASAAATSATSSATVTSSVTGAGGKRHRHRVVLAPLKFCAPLPVLRNADFFRDISTFYSLVATALLHEAEAEVLPYMSCKTRARHPIYGQTTALPLIEALSAEAIPYRARTHFVALSGCGDRFVNLDDLTTTLRHGLFCDRHMLPILDFTDGCRRDGAQVLVSACVSDFARCQAQFDANRSRYRFTALEQVNGLSQSECYAVLNHVEHTLRTLTGMWRSDAYEKMATLESLYPVHASNADMLMGVPAVYACAELLKRMRPQIEQRNMPKVIKTQRKAYRMP